MCCFASEKFSNRKILLLYIEFDGTMEIRSNFNKYTPREQEDNIIIYFLDKFTINAINCFEA